MDFDVGKAIQYFRSVVTQHYANFNGRVSRGNFWTYIVVYVAFALIVAIVQGVLNVKLLSLLYLLLFLPTAGIIARRLQDTGRSGTLVWLMMGPVAISILAGFLAGLSFAVAVLLLPLMLLLGLITLFATIYLIILCIQPGTPGPNAYGPQPAAAV
jgi:uncharacterized membrane protein YhaH (DUF805 family)